MSTREAILGRVARFLERHGLSERRFGELVARDPKFVSRLRSKSVTLSRIERAEAFMARHAEALPADAPMPERRRGQAAAA